MCGHLGVRLADKAAALSFQMGAQGLMVFDNAVMHDGNLALHISMGMGVAVRGFAVGGPAGVADTQASRQRMRLSQRFQRRNASRAFAYANAAVSQHGDACAVVSPVFQSPQPVQQNGLRILRANITYDSAHAFPSLTAAPAAAALADRPDSR